jgi:ABC-2 type transport system ATP-binding protein
VAEPVLAAEGLGKTYGDLVALQPLDLRVAHHEVVALVGHNGSGKSTFLRLAAGLLDATDGWVEIAGEPAGSTGACAATSYLPDDPVLYDDLSVREHLTYVAALYGSTPGEAAQDDLLRRLGLAERADDLPTRFSRGLRQKASIALGLIRPFELLLVDEPFVGLDTTGRAAMLELLDEASAGGAAVVVATHDPNFV